MVSLGSEDVFAIHWFCERTIVNGQIWQRRLKCYWIKLIERNLSRKIYTYVDAFILMLFSQLHSVRHHFILLNFWLLSLKVAPITGGVFIEPLQSAHSPPRTTQLYATMVWRTQRLEIMRPYDQPTTLPSSLIDMPKLHWVLALNQTMYYHSLLNETV